MGFDGANALSPLTFTGLTQFGIPDGEVPEPSNEALIAFTTAISELADGEAETTGEEMLTKAYAATSALCSGAITVEQFSAMPPRLFREFAKWLTSEFADPKD